MYRIILKKQNGREEVTYKKDMCISDLFKDINVMSVSIGSEERLGESYNAFFSYIEKLPAIDFNDGDLCRLAEFVDIENMKLNPCVRRIEFVKTLGEYVIFRVICCNRYGDDINLYFAVKAQSCDVWMNKTEV